MKDDNVLLLSGAFHPCIALIFQIKAKDDEFDRWHKNGRDDRIYRQGRFILFDSTNDACIRFGEFGKENRLRNGEICVKTVTPTTKRGYHDGSGLLSDVDVDVRVFEQIPKAENILMDYSYIGNRLSSH